MLVQKQLAGLGRIAPRPQRRLGGIEGVGIRRRLRGLGDNCVITPSGARVCSGDGSLPGTPGSTSLNCTGDKILNTAGTACVAAYPPTTCKDVIVTPAKTTCTGVAPNRVCVTTPAVTQQVCTVQAPPSAGYVWLDGRWVSQAQVTAAQQAEERQRQAEIERRRAASAQLTSQQQAAVVAQANNAALQTSAPATSVGDTISSAIASIPWYGWVVVAGGAFYFLGGGRR